MDAVLDTNLLYYIYDDSNSDLSSSKVLDYLKRNYANFYISEYAIMEMYTKYRKNYSSIISIINFLNSKNIPVILTLKEPYNIVSNEIISKMNNQDFFDYQINKTFERKRDIEASYLCFLTTTIASIVISCKCFLNNQTLKSSTYAKNLYIFLQSNAVKNSPLENNYKSNLNKFYEDGKESAFKDSVMDSIGLFCENVFTITEIEKKGYDTLKLDFKSPSGYDILETIINENIKIFQRIEKRFSGEMKIFSELEKSNLDINLSHFEESLILSKMFPIGRAKYLTSFLKSFFNSKVQKLSKNDIFDSLFLTHYPNQQLLTADTRFQNRIKDFDLDYYNNIINFINECKK